EKAERRPIFWVNGKRFATKSEPTFVSGWPNFCRWRDARSSGDDQKSNATELKKLRRKFQIDRGVGSRMNILRQSSMMAVIAFVFFLGTATLSAQNNGSAPLHNS